MTAARRFAYLERNLGPTSVALRCTTINARLSPANALSDRGDLLDQKRTDVAHVILVVGDYDPAATRGDQHEVRMRYTQSLAAVRPNFKGHEGRGANELADGFNQHDSGNVTLGLAERKTCREDSHPRFRGRSSLKQKIRCPESRC